MANEMEKRTSAGVWINPKSQLTLSFSIAAGFGLIAIALYVLLGNYQSYMDQLLQTNQIDTQTTILVTSQLYYNIRVVIFMAMAGAIIGFLLGLVYTHRIFGPVVQIRQQVTKMRNGNYEERIYLRNNDEFKLLATEVNALAEKLAGTKK